MLNKANKVLFNIVELFEVKIRYKRKKKKKKRNLSPHPHLGTYFTHVAV